MTSGYDHACALRRDRGLWCWGKNNETQIGDGTGTDRTVPVQVATDARAVTGGGYHTLALPWPTS